MTLMIKKPQIMTSFAKTIIQFQQQDEIWTKSNKRFYDNRPAHLPSFSNRFSNSTYIQNTYSQKIQPVIKIISKQTGLTQVRRLLDYIAREAKDKSEHLVLEDDRGRLFNHKEQRESTIRKWQKDFLSKESYEKQQWKLDLMEKLENRRDKLLKVPDSKLTDDIKKKIDDLTHQIDNQYYVSKTKRYDLKMRGASDTTHILLSAGAKPDESKAYQATKTFLRENFASQGFEYMFVKHNDTDNLHFHVVVKNRGAFKNLYFDKSDLFSLRQEYARHLSLNGIERVSTLRKDRNQVLDRVISHNENIKKRYTWYQSQLNKTSSKDRNFDVFSYRANLLKQTDYLIKSTSSQINNSGNDKKNLKRDLEHLKTLKKDLKKIDKDSFQTAKDKTLKSLNKDNKELVSKVEALSDDVQVRLTPLQKKKRKEYLKILLKKHVENLKLAKDVIKSESPNNFEYSAKQKEILKDLERMLKKSKSAIKGRGIGF